jgi:hypothetical protein
MPKSEYDEVDPVSQEEIDTVILAAHALELDAPIIQYRIVGSRIELWTCHGGPYTYDPTESPASAEKPPSKSSKPASKSSASKRKSATK